MSYTGPDGKIADIYDEERLLEIARQDVFTEYRRATAKFSTFASEHEGYAVLLEEVEELWEKIKSKDATLGDLREEAVQVGAMALRFIVDACNPKTSDREGGHSGGDSEA